MEVKIPNLEWGRYKAVLFDVDGTLYNQREMRRRMAIELGLHLAANPFRWKTAVILSRFRKLREEHFEREEDSLEAAQYRWVAEALNIPGERVRAVAEEWMLRRPLKHLQACRPPGLVELFERLHGQQIKIGVFSDYPAKEKLAALGLRADAVACAVDQHVNRLKPHTAGFQYLADTLKVLPGECLHIGDREDRDDICAKRFGCDSLIISAADAMQAGATRSYDRLFPNNRTEAKV